MSTDDLLIIDKPNDPNKLVFDRVINKAHVNRERRINGFINCIPWPFKRFSEHGTPGIESGKYSIVTANTKVGKTQLTDFMFIYWPLYFLEQNPDVDMDIKILYYTLEMSKEEKIAQALCHKLFIDSKLKNKRKLEDADRLDYKDLMSIRESYVLADYIMDRMKSMRDWFDMFEKKVIFKDDVRHPFSLHNDMMDYVKANGKFHKKTITVHDKDEFGQQVEKQVEVMDWYEPHRREEIVIPIIDHVSLIQPHKGITKYDAIEIVSQNLMKVRTNFGLAPVLVQQQMMTQESTMNRRFNTTEPSLDGLGDNKATGRDADVIYGLYSPARYDIPTYHGYDIARLRDNFRSLSIIGGRQGGIGVKTPLFFDGAVNYFQELPYAQDPQMDYWYAASKYLFNLTEARLNGGVLPD